MEMRSCHISQTNTFLQPSSHRAIPYPWKPLRETHKLTFLGVLLLIALRMILPTPSTARQLLFLLLASGDLLLLPQAVNLMLQSLTAIPLHIFSSVKPSEKLRALER